ncbi:MAG TPA: FtsK/SpoIIIE domain-containing protein [Actinomycetales bacterium]|nr:FtsK/SpoIIIE domain-containing protein [Actinomycetales bacterium]
MEGYFVDVIAGPAAGGSLKITPGQTRVIGRSRTTDLSVLDDLISAQHLIIRYGTSLVIQDLATTNGTTLHRGIGESERFRAAARPWDPADLVQLGSHIFQLRPTRVSPAQTAREGGYEVVHLSPPPPPPPEPSPVAAPPQAPAEPAPRRIPWVGMISSALGGLVMAAVFRTAFLLLFSVLAPAGMLAQHAWERRRERAEHRRALSEHDLALARHCVQEGAYRSERGRRARLTAIDPAACRRHIAVPTVELWQAQTELTQAQLFLGLITDGAGLLPFHLRLDTGAVGIFGPPVLVAALVRWLMVQVAARFAPSRLRLSGPWEWVLRLPHATSQADLFAFIDAAQMNGSQTAGEIIFAASRAQLPAHCATVIEVRGDYSARCELLSRNAVYEITHLSGIGNEVARGCATDMGCLRDRESLPRATRTLGELWGDTDECAIAAQWARTAATPGRLHAPIGQNSDGKPLAVDMSVDGPHALIGGTTGAGKSVLQRALVLSLALTQRPEHLAIVLVDYKGGAAFRALESLPHVIDVVTDLAHSATVRVVASLRAELRRRERLLADHGLTDHDQLAAAGFIAEAPRLVLIIDELRALADQQAHLLEELVQLAALGRSLGIHLVLATQRPGASVNADMRANINMRIALRVQSAADSHDILDLPDAAQLSAQQPGSALIRLGSAPAREFQVANVCDADTAALVEKISRAARQIGAQPPRRPWLAPLPAVVREVPVDAKSNGTVLVGLRDHPMDLKQDALRLELGGGHLLIAGGPGMGRTAALRALARHSPVPVHVIAREPGRVADLSARWVGTGAHLEDQRIVARLCAQLLDQPPHDRLLLVDDAHWFIDPENPLNRAWAAIQEVLRRGGAQGITVALAGGRLLLMPRISELAAHRWILNWADDTAQTSGLLPRSAVLPPGPGGLAQVVGGAAIAARVRWVDEPAAGSWPTPPSSAEAQQHPIVRLRPIPQHVAPKDLAAASVSSGQGAPDNEGRATSSKIKLGIGGDSAKVVTLPLDSFLIAGPAGSGRTSALHIVAKHGRAIGRRVRFLTPENARAELDAAHNADVLLFDDLDLALNWDPHAHWVETLAQRLRAGQTVVAAAATAACASSYSGLLAHLRRLRTGVVLHPHERGSNEVFGVNVARESDSNTPGPGRGVVVEAGVTTALQMVQSDP